MPWPTPQDYNEAVQNPRLVFADADLRAGQPELNQLGLPRPISGGFACVYKVQCSPRAWAARCFLTEIADQQERYEAIDRHLAKVRLPYMVRFGYQCEGIKVKGRAYPLLKMGWVKGVTLGSYVGNNLSNPAALGALAEKWLQMLKALQQAEVAHGDLQHGNVLVVGGELRLIDYDGMYVPELAGRFSNEVGHRNYQHPHRTNINYGPYLDNFSGWAVYVALEALSDRPQLWSTYDGGDECLLFRRQDFETPQASAVFGDVCRSANAKVRALGEFLAHLSGLSVLDVPALDVGHEAPVTGAAGQAGFGGEGDWWRDHIDGEASGADVRGGGSGGDVAWIVEEAAGPVGPVERVGFQTSFKGIRVVASASFAAVLVTGFAAGLPAFVFLSLGLGVLGVVALHCFVRYRGDPSLEEFRLFKSALADLVKRVAEKRSERGAVEESRARVVAAMSAAQLDWSNSQRQVEGNLQGRLSSVLRLLDERRRNIAEREGAELRCLQARLSDRIAGLQRDISGLAAKETWEKERALQVLRKAHVESFMREYSIASSYLPGIGPGNAARLAARGFVTAADLDRYGSMSVSGIGPKRADALTGWRDLVRARAEGGAPAFLSRAEAGKIETNFGYQRTRLVNEKKGLEEQLQAGANSIRQKYALERAKVDSDERGRREVNSREIAILRQRYAQRVDGIDKEVQSRWAKDQATVAEMTERLRDLDRSLYVLQWRCTKKEREGLRYAGLDFRHFVGEVVGL